MMELQTFLAPKLPDYLTLLKQMVAINSFTANPAGVNALGDFTAASFVDLGFTAERIQSANPEYGRHLVLTRPGRGRQKIGLVSHLDTVFPPEEELDNNFFWRPDGDRIYGPGTVDVKGGTVMIRMVLDAARHLRPDLFDEITWVILLDAAEEAEADDFGALCRQRLGEEALACLVFEGGNMAGDDFMLVVARKGMAVYEATVEGKAAHAGSAHNEGANAIVQMADVIGRIAALTDYQQELTFNVGVVRGGTVTNRVPHTARISGEMRAFDPQVYEGGLAQLMALAGSFTPAGGDGLFPCRVTVDVVRQTAPWPRNEMTDRLYAVWQEAAQAAGLRVIPEERGGLSDGNHTWATIPTLDGLGPAGGNAHCSERSEDGGKDQEYVLVSSFIPKAILNTAAIIRLVVSFQYVGANPCVRPEAGRHAGLPLPQVIEKIRLVEKNN